jgi:hypothetical protein
MPLIAAGGAVDAAKLRDEDVPLSSLTTAAAGRR